jgi:hypothetical protein
VAKVYDCIPFFNELEVLDLRFRMHYDHVDHFVITEATETFTGLAKPLYFKENIERYRPYLDKVIHITVDDTPKSDSFWVKEEYQKDQIRRGLKEAADDDLLLICDADEILRPEAIAAAKAFDGFSEFDMPMFQFFLNLCERQRGWTAAYAIKKHMLASFGNLSKARFGREFKTAPEYQNRCQIVQNAGWHFTHLGGIERIKYKYRSYSHSDDKFPRAMRPDGLLERHIATGGVVGNFKDKARYVHIDETYPAYIRDNIGHYEQLGFVGDVYDAYTKLQDEYFFIRNCHAINLLLDSRAREELFRLTAEDFLPMAGLDRPFPTQHQYLAPFPGRLVSKGKPATQSSICKWSLGDTVESDAAGAVSGKKDGEHHFHTDREHNPWWMVDLEEVVPVIGVCIYNRLKPRITAERANRILVEMGGSPTSLVPVYQRMERRAFGGADGHPLELLFEPPISARYVRLSLPGIQELHLDQVEVYATE